jgi:DNA primase large subunit
MRLAITAESLSRGLTVDQTTDLFRNQTDFNESKTRYFVADASKKGYKPFKCKAIRELSFCLGEACPIFRKKEGYN